MASHQTILLRLLDTCASIHPDCAVVLIGSVASGTQVAGSDLDLTLVFPGEQRPAVDHPYIADDNRWQLVVKDVIDGVRIDIAWETQHALHEHVTGPDVRGCWPISNGRLLRDPQHIAAPSIAIARQWFADHPEVREQIERDYAEAKRRQRETRQ